MQIKFYSQILHLLSFCVGFNQTAGDFAITFNFQFSRWSWWWSGQRQIDATTQMHFVMDREQLRTIYFSNWIPRMFSKFTTMNKQNFCRNIFHDNTNPQLYGLFSLSSGYFFGTNMLTTCWLLCWLPSWLICWLICVPPYWLPFWLPR